MSVETVSGAASGAAEGLAQVQARIAQLQALVGGQRPGGVLGGTDVPAATGAAGASGAAGRKAFASALAGALDGTAASGEGTDALAALLGGAQAAGGAQATPSSSTSSPSSTRTGADAVRLASSFSGVPYRWGGTDPSTGLDCSGLTQLVMGRLGVDLPRTAAQQARVGTPVASLAEARPGDLVFFGSPVHHVGVYAGNGQMVDAPHTGSTVGLHKLWGTPVAIRRVLPAGGTAAPTGAGFRARPFADLFAAAGAKYGVDPALLSAVARAESGYDPAAVSGAGARGLMQLMPSTAAAIGVDPSVPAQAVDGAARLLSGYLRENGGRTDLALASYNAGPGAVRRYGGVPPFAETQTYVRRVLSYWRAG